MDELATKTLAEIYLRQGHLREAFEIFKALAEKKPQDTEVKKKLEEVREKLYPSPIDFTYPQTKEDKIYQLEKWLENIRKRGKK